MEKLEREKKLQEKMVEKKMKQRERQKERRSTSKNKKIMEASRSKQSKLTLAPN